MHTRVTPVGEHLRAWRQRRRISQLELALQAEVSARHLSFVETGRAMPSRQMVVRLAERLDVPLRERNVLLLAAGYAPLYRARSLDDPELAPARQALTALLEAHEPNPALVVDRHWTMVAANGAVRRLLEGVDPAQLQPPVNVLRLTLQPGGLASRILNLDEWRDHVLARLRHQHRATGDPVLRALLDELRDSAPARDGEHHESAAFVVPLKLASPQGELSFISTTTVFGTPLDVTLAELAIETFFPADPATAAALRR